MAWTYLLHCRDGTYYVGSAVDLDRRLAQHRSGQGAAYTRLRRPVRVVWAAWFEHAADAHRVARQVQGWPPAGHAALARGRTGGLPELVACPDRVWRPPRAGPGPGRAGTDGAGG